MTDDPWALPRHREQPPPISILLATSHYRGDHAADVTVAIQAVEGETVLDLVKRSGLNNKHDHIEIRLEQERNS